MNAPAFASAIEAELNNLVSAQNGNGAFAEVAKQESPTPPAAQTGKDAERIRSSVSRLASNSIEELGALTAELQEVQAFLKSEVERVQSEIDNALAGIRIIMETIAPWKSLTDMRVPPNSARAVRGGPAASIASGSPPYGKTSP
jgi:hypothetical protein